MKITVEDKGFSYSYSWERQPMDYDDDDSFPDAQDAVDVALTLLKPFFSRGEIARVLRDELVLKDYE